MEESVRIAHGKVNGWLQSINGDPSGEDPIDEKGVAVVTREDGEQLLLRVTAETVSFYVAILEVPAEGRVSWFEAALAFNLHPGAVKGGLLAYDDGAGTITHCAHVPLDTLTEPVFFEVISNVLRTAEEIREQFFALGGIAVEEKAGVGAAS